MTRLAALVSLSLAVGCVDVPDPAGQGTQDGSGAPDVIADAMLDGMLDGRPAVMSDAIADDGMPPFDASLDATGSADMALDVSPTDADPLDASPPDVARALDAAQPTDGPPPTPCLPGDLYFEQLRLCMNIEALPPLPDALFDPLLAVLGDGTLLVLQNDAEAGEDGLAAARTFALQPGADVWSVHAGPGQPREGATLTVLPEMGAVLAGGLATREVANTVERWDQAESAWVVEPPAITPRMDHGAFVYQGRLVLVGGRDEASMLASTEVWPPIEPLVDVPALPTARIRPLVGTLDDGVMLFGGAFAEGATNDCQVWLGGDRWAPTRGETPPIFLNGAGFAADGDTVVLGGGDLEDGRPTDRLFVWQQNAGWSEAASLDALRKHHSFTSLGDGRVLVFGSSPRIALVDTASGVVDAVDAPADMAAQRRRHGAAATDGPSAVVLGGVSAGQSLDSGWRMTVYAPLAAGGS